MKYFILILMFWSSCAFFDYVETDDFKQELPKLEKESVVKTSNKIIRIYEDVEGVVRLGIDKASVSSLVGVNADEISYCLESSPLTEMFLNMNTNLIETTTCTNWVSYQALNKYYTLGDLEFVNIFAKHNDIIYPYQRIMLSENIMFLNTCDFSMSETVYVLNQSMSCEGIEMTNIYINGNDKSITFLNTPEVFYASFIQGVYIFSKYLATNIHWSSVEKNVIHARGGNLVGDTNFFSNMFYVIDDVYSEFEQGIVANKIVDNFLWSKIHSNIVAGKIYSGSIVGGLVGFAITFTEMYYNDVMVEFLVEEPIYQGCLFGASVDNPELIDNVENCTNKEVL